MLIDTDLVFDDLVGYEFYHRCEVKAVIGDKLKGDEGEVLEFLEDIEYVIDEYDEVIILRRRETIQELMEYKKYLIDNNNFEFIDRVDDSLKIAEKHGVYTSYACVHDDCFYSLYSFSL